MRIALDGIPLNTPRTGIGHYTFELASALARLSPADDFELVANIDVALSAQLAAGTGDGDALPPNLRAAFPRTAGLRSRWWSLGLPLYARESRLALFHGTNYHVPLWGQCPAVVSVHDLSPLLHPETHPERLVRLTRARLPTMLRAAAHVLTDSESVRAEIVEHLHVAPGKVTAVPLAPRRSFRPMDADAAREICGRLGVGDDFLLFVGTVEPRKNLLTLVRAFDLLLRETAHRPRLVIAGQRGWLNEELYALVEGAHLRERVLFTGYVTDEELRALYTSCRLTVYPSLYEGFGLPPLEAMACGAPVVASRIPVIEETVGGAALLVPPTDAGELAAAVARLLEDDAARGLLVAEGFARAAQFTWERTARLTLEIYRSVMRAPAA
jgi:alpha-1,3-rhamnosyl/mannosyltransferase